MKTGIIGLGAMGFPIAMNLHQAGHLVCAWNRTHATAETLAAHCDNLEIASNPAALAARCELILISVSADADLRQVIDALLPALTPGTIIVDTSTVSSATVRDVAHQVVAQGAQFLDAPVSGGVEGAKNAALAMMVGGDATALEKIRTTLQVIAQRIVHMGPSGSGQATKAVNQIMAAGINQAVTEALAFAQAMQLPLDKVIEVVSSGAAGNWFLNHRGPSMVRDSYAPGFKVALHHKDLAICKRMADDVGMSLPVVEMTLMHYEKLIETGYGDEDISALFRLKKP